MVSKHLSLMLEWPIEATDARRRGIDPAVLRAVVTARQDGMVDGAALARVVECLRSPSEGVFFRALGPFVSAKECGLDTLSGIQISPDQAAVRTANLHGTEQTLSLWKAEQLVMFAASEAEAGRVLAQVERRKAAWWQLARHGEEAPYLQELSAVGTLAFFSETRCALEVLGQSVVMHRLLAYLRSALKLAPEGDQPEWARPGP